MAPMLRLDKGTGFGQILDEPVMRCPEREAIVYNDWRITYGELGRLVNQTARCLLSLGLTRGSRVAVISSNCPECLIIELAALKLGVVSVKLDWRISPEEMGYILRLNDVQCVFLRAENPTWGDRLVSYYAGRIRFLRLEEQGSRSALYELVGEFPSGKIETLIAPEEESLHMHTDGTDGRPQCVVYTHGSMLAQLESATDLLAYSDGARCLFTAQLFGSACSGAYMSLCSGGTLVLMKRFSPDTYLRQLVSEGITAIGVGPAALAWLLDELDKKHRDLSRLKVIRYSGGSLTPELLDRAIRRLDCHFYRYYGMTEMGGIVTALVSEDHFSENGAHLSTVGRPIPGAEMMVAAADGTACAPDEVGEIWLKGPGRMKCYLGRAELTSSSFAGDWYHTGDLGYIDRYHYLHLCGRDGCGKQEKTNFTSEGA